MNEKVPTGLSCSFRMLTSDECLERAVELMKAVAPAFQNAAGEVDEVSAIRLCAMGNAVCFVGENNEKLSALIILEIMQFPNAKICNVLAYAGSARKFYQFQEMFEDWAREQGATQIRGYGTEAPMRLAKRHGYREIYRVYAKPL